MRIHPSGAGSLGVWQAWDGGPVWPSRPGGLSPPSHLLLGSSLPFSSASFCLWILVFSPHPSFAVCPCPTESLYSLPHSFVPGPSFSHARLPPRPPTATRQQQQQHTYQLNSSNSRKHLTAMKNVLNYALAATMAASATASSHHHLHRHAKKHGGSRVEKRAPDAVTVYVAGATATAYEMGGKPYDAASAQACIKEGNCVVVGETTPTFSPPPPPPKPTTTSKAAAQFIEKPSTTSSPPPPPPKTTTSQAPPPPASTQAKPAKSNSFNSGATGVDAEFPSGKIKCSEFPSDYGALALDWLDLGKWSGLQFVPDFSPGALSISNIVTGVTGQTCSKGCMCSYACPPGYQKTQWSSAQGSTKQSIGGLYCNSNGYLELTRKSATTLCEKGAGGVTIQNDLSEVVSTCRTDYPGTESMVIPLVAQPGGSVDVTNPVQSKYYQWDGQKTTAQYYINPKGLGPKDACVWNSPACPKCAGNWAGVNLGVGQDDSGTTWIGLFANAPTSTAKLDFNIEITGDVSIKCGYSNGQFTGGSNGCTAALKSGGKAVVRYY